MRGAPYSRANLTMFFLSKVLLGLKLCIASRYDLDSCDSSWRLELPCVSNYNLLQRPGVLHHEYNLINTYTLLRTPLKRKLAPTISFTILEINRQTFGPINWSYQPQSYEDSTRHKFFYIGADLVKVGRRLHFFLQVRALLTRLFAKITKGMSSEGWKDWLAFFTRLRSASWSNDWAGI
jgi:hypothetical protein